MLPLDRTSVVVDYADVRAVVSAIGRCSAGLVRYYNDLRLDRTGADFLFNPRLFRCQMRSLLSQLKFTAKPVDPRASLVDKAVRLIDWMSHHGRQVALVAVGASLLGIGLYAVVSMNREPELDLKDSDAGVAATEREYVPESSDFIESIKRNTLQLAQVYNDSNSLHKESKSRSKKYMDYTLKKEEKISEMLKIIEEKLKNYPPILMRKFKDIDDLKNIYHDAKRQFRIMQWNALGKTMITSDEGNLPGFKLDAGYHKLLKNEYGSHADWENFRKWRLLEELVRYRCDVICLQEADFYEDIRPYMEDLGYRGIFCPKFSHLNKEIDPEGIALFYHLDTFQLAQLRCQNIQITGENCTQVFIIMQLIHRATKRRVTVVTTHLKAFDQFRHKRFEQTQFILDTLKGQMVDEAHYDDLATRPVIICGDFNGLESESFYKLLTGHSYFKLADAYRLNKRWIANHPERNIYNRFVDYMFFTKPSVYLIKFLAIDVIRRDKVPMPCLLYPSDHQALVCDFQLV